jgi:hypothetical protein
MMRASSGAASAQEPTRGTFPRCYCRAFSMAAITSGESGVTFGSKRATVKDLSHRNGESRAQRQSERQRATWIARAGQWQRAV